MSEDPFNDPTWLSYAAHVRKELIPMIRDSAVTLAMYTGADPDPKMAIELGYMVLLDKPIITVVTPGVKVPNKLAIISDAIVEAVDDPAETARRIKAAITELDIHRDDRAD